MSRELFIGGTLVSDDFNHELMLPAAYLAREKAPPPPVPSTQVAGALTRSGLDVSTLVTGQYDEVYTGYWYKPMRPELVGSPVRIILFGGGGGGGGGTSAAAATACSGGSGGGGGARVEYLTTWDYLGLKEKFVVGLGGVGGGHAVAGQSGGETSFGGSPYILPSAQPITTSFTSQWDQAPYATEFTTWDPNKRSSNAALSGDNLIMTGNNFANNWVKSTTKLNPNIPAVYVEFTVTTNANCVLGLADNAFPQPWRPWTPVDLVTDLRGWLDAADAATVTVTGSGVSQWTDKSTYGRSVTQATDAQRPAYPGGKITFIGQQSLFTAGNWPTTYDYIIVGKMNSAANWRSLLYASGSHIPLIIDGSNPGKVGVYSSAAFNQAGTLTWANGTDGMVYGSISNVANCSLAVNGSDLFTTGQPCEISPIIHINRGDNPQPFGDVYEFILLPHNLAIASKQKLEGYLAHKWGLAGSLPANHPYKGAQPTIDVMTDPMTHPGVDNHSFGIYPSGTVATNGGYISAGTSFTTGSRVGMVYRQDTKRVYYKVETGNWNNQAAADPSNPADTYGIPVAAFNPTNDEIYVIVKGDQGCVVTANFGGTNLPKLLAAAGGGGAQGLATASGGGGGAGAALPGWNGNGATAGAAGDPGGVAGGSGAAGTGNGTWIGGGGGAGGSVGNIGPSGGLAYGGGPGGGAGGGKTATPTYLAGGGGGANVTGVVTKGGGQGSVNYGHDGQRGRLGQAGTGGSGGAADSDHSIAGHTTGIGGKGGYPAAGGGGGGSCLSPATGELGGDGGQGQIIIVIGFEMGKR